MYTCHQHEEDLSQLACWFKEDEQLMGDSQLYNTEQSHLTPTAQVTDPSQPSAGDPTHLRWAQHSIRSSDTWQIDAY